jgi:hypothetical protein
VSEYGLVMSGASAELDAVRRLLAATAVVAAG